MATEYILSAAGTTNPILDLDIAGVTGTLSLPTLQDVSISNANDTYTWTQLNEASKLQVATTATNSISTNLVVEYDTFFGDATATTGSAAKLGLYGLSKAKSQVEFSVNIGTKTLSGIGYITGLTPAVSADSPVWVTPVTIAVSGDFVVA
jgi:hypothetical protein